MNATIEMVVMANAIEGRGRSIVGILLHEGRPVIENGKPKWIKPRVSLNKREIPAPLVVDLLPRDIVEFEINQALDFSMGCCTLEVDFYTLSIKGRLAADALQPCCWIPCFPAFLQNFHLEAIEESPCLILACECTVVGGRKDRETPNAQIELKFGYNGEEFQYPLADPQIIEFMELAPELIDRQQSLQLLLSPQPKRLAHPRQMKVLSVLY